MTKVIYDFGANNGDDIPYYLKKSDIVVAVEANPSLCREIEARFPNEISHGRLHLENCVLTAENEKDVVFYIHKHNHVLSQFPKPSDTEIHNFDEIVLRAILPNSIIKKYGDPFYIKIDIEHYDQYILDHLFRNNIYPPYISAESHSIEVFALLVAVGHYTAFKLVDGSSVSIKYKTLQIIADNRTQEVFSFPFHSAGPFGEDILGDWMRADDFFILLALSGGLGWKDIHATNLKEIRIVPPQGKLAYIRAYVINALRRRLRNMFLFK